MLTGPTHRRSRPSRVTGGLLSLLLLVGLGAHATGLPEAPWGAPELLELGDPASGWAGQVRDQQPNPLAVDAPPVVTWPAPGRADLTATAQPQTVAVGGLPVAMATTDGVREQPVSVEVLGRTSGFAGVLVELTGAGGPLDLSVNYHGFAAGYGGDYGARLRMVELPGCALATGGGCAGAPQPLESRNDSETQVVSATVDPSPSGTLVGIMAAEDSPQGDYQATALSPSSQWSAGGSSGAFTWSYPVAVPPVPGGLAPSIGVSYSSQAVDGRTAMTNNQGSWIGEGFGYEPGYVERRYKSCDDDGHAGKADRCWAWDNATIMLGGRSGELVRDGGTWRIESDDGSKVERLTGAVNGDDNGEYWQVTTTDGTRYVFGRHRLPSWGSGDPVTDSVWTAPVFGDDSGEPCHDTTFASSHCDQAWRWNLDYVEDPRGNVVSYFYGKEINHYARNGDTAVDGTAYTRGGFLKRIEYGQRAGTIYTTPAPARVVFTVAERCLPDGEVSCAPGELTNDTADHWPDVPWDLHCVAGTHCEVTESAPSFWTRKRLTGIRTEVRTGGAYQPVSSWELAHSFVSNADLSRSLWLESVTRTGHAGDGPDVTLPPTTLLPVQRPNRVDEIGDNISPLIRPRLAAVYTDAGGQIDVTYSGEDCAPGDTPSPSSNARRCFPVRWQPDSASDLITDWFHKYVVADVVVSDRVGESLDQVTRYQYLGGAAWRHSEPDGIIDQDALTWGQWRGYETVRVIGAPDTTLATRTDHTYFRGMHGDDDGSGGTRDVSVTDSTGVAHRDHDALAGRQLERVTYNESAVVSKAIAAPWRHVTATDSHSWGTQRAVFVRDDVTTTYVTLQAGGWRTTRVDHDYDPDFGRLVSTDDHGDLSTTADDRCTRVQYADNPAAHQLDYPSRVETVTVQCSVTPDRAADVLSDDRTFYDGGGFGQAPSQGLVTASQRLASHDGSTAAYQTVAEIEYDSYGRVTEQRDAAGTPITTGYTDSDGLTVGQTVSNALGHTVTSTVDPMYSQPVDTVDANDKQTSFSYDGLGRLTGVWLPNRRKATGWSPNYKFSYHITGDAPVAVVTESLNADAISYRAERKLFDGWLRTRQTQVPGPGSGRLVTDTFYDALGRVHRSNDLYYAEGAPSNTLLVVADGEVNGQNVTTYDRAGRPVEEIFQVAGQAQWRTTTSYGGDRVHTTPPPGGTAITVIDDARGNPVELRQYLGGAPTGNYDATTYQHTPRGELAEVTDPAGNVWTYQYDQRGRKIASTDPDSGATTYAYDALDQLVSTTDARGVTLSHSYDVLGRKTATYEGDPATGTQLGQWFWDNFQKGQLAGSRSFEDDLTITVTVPTRDYLYRPTTNSYHLAGTAAGELAGSYSFTTEFNQDHTVQSTTFPAVGGLPVAGINYSYDQLRRAVNVFGEVGYASQIDYYPTGELAQVGMFAGATDAWRSFEYERGTNRLTRSFVSVEGVAGKVSDMRYTYDPAGNVTSIIDDPSAAGAQRDAQCFGYDHLRRLITAWTTAAAGEGATACAGGPEATGVAGPAAYWHDYGFDPVGNRTTVVEHAAGSLGSDVTTTYSYPAAGSPQPHTLQQATSTDGSQQTYDYDAAGNTTSADRDGTTETLTWGPQGHLQSITEGGQTTEFCYDADGNRVVRDGPDGKTLFLPGLELHQPVGATTVTATRYIELPGGVTYVETAGGPAVYQISDHHGTANLSLEPDTGAVTHRRLDPYGNLRGTAPVDWAGQRGFVGGTLDPTGYTHLGAREYDPATGRFISLDPIMDLADPQQMHGYAYANNNPITFSDPSGLLCAPDANSLCPGQDVRSQPAGRPRPRPPQRTWDDDWNCVDYCGSAADNKLRNMYGLPSNGRAGTTGHVGPGGEGVTYDQVAREFGRAGWEDLSPEQRGMVERRVMERNNPVALRAYQDARISPMELVVELSGLGDVQRCLDGDWGSCAWLVVGVIPYTKVVHFARALNKLDNLRAAVRAVCSFSADTLVLMADGATRPIAEILPGDRVLATDPESGEQSEETVAAVWVHGDTLLALQVIQPAEGISDGKADAQMVTVTTTADHPFWNHTDQQWQPATTLDPGDQLLTDSTANTPTVIGLLPYTQHTGTAYNLTITGSHTYYVFAGNVPVLVHNTACDGDEIGIEHATNRHTRGGSQVTPDAGIFDDGVDLATLARGTAGQIGRRQENENIIYVLQSRQIVGVDGRTGMPTNVYTVIRNPYGELVTLHPGK